MHKQIAVGGFAWSPKLAKNHVWGPRTGIIHILPNTCSTQTKCQDTWLHFEFVLVVWGLSSMPKTSSTTRIIKSSTGNEQNMLWWTAGPRPEAQACVETRGAKQYEQSFSKHKQFSLQFVFV
jgi:hypothetical protein